MHIPHVHLRCNKQSDINIFYVKNLCLQSTRTHKNLENLQKLIFFLHFTNVLTRKTRSLQNVYLNNGLKFNDGWGITLQSGGKKSKHWIFFDTLSRLRINSLFHYVSNNEKKNVYIMPSFSHKKGRTQKSAFQKDLASSLFTKKEYLRMYIFCYPQTEKHWLVEDSSFLFSKRKEKWKNEGCQRCRKLTFSAILFFVH